MGCFDGQKSKPQQQRVDIMSGLSDEARHTENKIKHDANVALCELCGEPMPAGEEMFQYHGNSGKCPGPPLSKNQLKVAQANADNPLPIMVDKRANDKLKAAQDRAESGKPAHIVRSHSDGSNVEIPQNINDASDNRSNEKRKATAQALGVEAAELKAVNEQVMDDKIKAAVEGVVSDEPTKEIDMDRAIQLASMEIDQFPDIYMPDNISGLFDEVRGNCQTYLDRVDEHIDRLTLIRDGLKKSIKSINDVMDGVDPFGRNNNSEKEKTAAKKSK